MLRDFSQFKLNEAIQPSLSPVRRGLGQATGTVRFFDINGNTITQIECGKSYMFEVPGYTEVYLKVTKNGVSTYDGLFTVPMPPYTSMCQTDPGKYEAIALDPSNMNEIGRASLEVTGGGLFGLSNTTLLLLGGGALLLMMRRK